MQKVAPISICALSLLEKVAAFFCLIQSVLLVVFPELVRPMGKFAFIPVWTIPVLNKLLAQLRLLLKRKPWESLLGTNPWRISLVGGS